jgi:predicted cobalt transporter CbtA
MQTLPEMPDNPAAPEPERRLWPWVILALLLAAGITLFFIYVPGHAGDQPAASAISALRRA